jgi:hypothetical protein
VVALRLAGHDVAWVRLDAPGSADRDVLARAQAEIYLDNVAHPAATRLALAKASRGHMHAFGINWDDTTGKNNGHFAPFSWSSS